MFLLKFIECDREHRVGLFSSREGVKEFLKNIPSFEWSSDGGDYEFGKFQVSALPDYMEIKYGKKRFPLSRFSFADDTAEAIAVEIENFDDGKTNSVEAWTLVDAYCIGNHELKTYIEKRERNFLRVKAVLEKKGFSVFREYHGSEDGEAITYRNAQGEHHFLMHMDPSFVDDLPEDDAELERYLREME